ncbi:MAG TPA: hypothetical protein VGH28_09775 [Polyangiaceae bacterium]|jgi:hypothetical protein
MRLSSRTALFGFLGAGVAALGGLAPTACFPAAGEGVDPPAFDFYFPVGFAVSRGGNVLYAVNSDFDLQWNGGTMQSLDLHAIRRDAIRAIADPNDPNLPLAQAPDRDASCPNGPPVITNLYDAGVEPGLACAPPTNASAYMRDSAVIGAFATEVQLSLFQNPDRAGSSRLFTPVRGDASLSWADVVDDDPSAPPKASDTVATYAPFKLDCGTRDAHGRCDAFHRTGNNAGQMGDTRFLTMPGEPFGMAQSQDGSAVVITHQADVLTSLFSTFTPGNAVGSIADMPAIQFVLSGVPTGGIGVAAIPHDPLAYPECFPDATTDACKAAVPRPAFLESSRAAAQVALIRYYSDIGASSSSLFRPFITEDAVFNLNTQAGTTDFARGIAIDPTPRIRCMTTIKVPTSDPAYGPAAEACARLPARVFVASRGPASLIIGKVGQSPTVGGSWDADYATFDKTVVLDAGPSALHLAPIIDSHGNFAMRVFIVCFDSSEILDYDPDNDRIEARIHVGLGPFALTFDPFDFDAAARGDPAPAPAADADINLRPYRFAYVGSFTDSYMQVLDLDLSRPDTWGTIVYTVGVPTPPKGS